MRSFRLIVLLLPLGLLPVTAFPPAPSYTLFGMVRDQVGQTVAGEGASVVVYRGTEEIGRSRIVRGLGIDHNYALELRIDANRPSTQLYNEGAVAAQGDFSLVVEMNGVLFYPIEASGPLTAGTGGETVRLDLNLGEDLDGDGLPDVWEQWQLYQAGRFPDENGDWALHLLSRDGDFDGDGQSDWNEYIAGTFATDPTERFAVEIREKADDHVRFEFYAITGKTYTIEKRTAAGDWVRLPVSAEEAGERFAIYTATTVGVRSLYCEPTAATAELFRLTVR